jgi:uncharacterized protein (TIGR03437 family)
MRYAAAIAVCALFFPPAPVLGQPRVITTIAGTDWLFPGNGQAAINAPLSGTFGLDVAVDKLGNYYIADNGNLEVMRVGSDGILDVIAGNGILFSSGDGGLAVNASLFQPTAVAVDSQGNVYIADYGGNVRKVTSSGGLIHTIAGPEAQLKTPYGLAVDSVGNVFVADTGNNRIRKIAPDGAITTYAGNGQQGVNGDNRPPASAQINSPTRLAVDASGNLYINEFGFGSDVTTGRIRMVTAGGKSITTIAGGGMSASDAIPATSAAIFPLGVAVDSSGTVYVLDYFVKGVREVKQGTITTIAGNGSQGFSGDGGPALRAQFNIQFYPAVAVDSAGDILVADEFNQRIRKIKSGIVNTVAGNGLFHFSGNGGPATSAALNLPNSVVTDNHGNTYLTEPGLNRIRRIDPGGIINIFAGNGIQNFSGDGGPATSAALAFPSYLAINPLNGDLFFTDAFNCVIRYIDANGIIHTYAGQPGVCGYGGDEGSATQAAFSAGLQGIDFDSAGNLFVADSLNNAVRVVIANAASIQLCKVSQFCVLTIANNSVRGVKQPVGVRVHDTGVYFCDTGNNVVRRFDLNNGALTIVAGNGKAGSGGDGGPASQASLNNPSNVAFDSAGNMYVADTLNRVVRKIAPPLDGSGTVSIFAGSPTAGAIGDGGPAASAALGDMTDIFVDRADNVLLTDLVLNRIRAVLTTLPSFQVNPTNLAFTAPAGASAVSLGLDLAGSIPGVPFTASASSSGWLEVLPGSGVMPATIQVTADPSKLSANFYQGTITINAPYANPPTQNIPVAFTVTAPGQPSLDVKPSSLNFSYVQKAAANSRQLVVSNAGGGSLSLKIAASTVSGGMWLITDPKSGAVGAFASTAISITADPAGLAPGTYSGTILVSSASPAQSIVVPVTMTVSAVPQTILVPQTGLTFYAVQGGGPALPQFLDVLNTGVRQMDFSVHATTQSGGSWLAVFPSTGVSDASSPVVPEVRVDVNPGSLQAGIYYGTVEVSATGASNTPQFVSIVLNVLKPGTNIGPIVEPSGLLFKAVAGGESPSSQTIMIQNTSGSPVNFHSGRVTVDGNNWLTSSPSDGTVTPTSPTRIVVQPQTGSLGQGVYQGTLTLSFSDGSRRVVSVVLVIVAPGSALPSSARTAAAAPAACAPKKLIPLFTQLPSGFSVPGGFPVSLETSVVDDCANPMVSGGVTVSFSNGDPAMRLTSLKNGSWAGTWVPGVVSPQTTVTALAEIPEQNLKGTVQVKGGVAMTVAPPVIATGGVVSAAASSQALLAPGSLITIYGSRLSQGQVQAKSPYPTTLAGSRILLANRYAPLSFASNGQINAIVPYGIAVNTAQQVLASAAGALSIPQPVNVAAAAPAIFTTNNTGQGQGVIVGVPKGGGSQAIADAAHPVKAGDAIVVYCTGLGEVSPPVPAGTPAPPALLSRTVNAVTATIGGFASHVFFAGLAPGFVGMYQVNVTVPSGITPGNQVPVVLTAAGQRSNAPTIAVK